MVDVGDGLLPGEQVLWTGTPGRFKMSRAEAGFSVYLAVALVVVAAMLPLSLRTAGPTVALVVIIWCLTMATALALLAYLVVLRPASLKRETYQVTSLRVLVTSELAGRRTWSAYLPQVMPVVDDRKDGATDLWLREPDQSWLARALVLYTRPFIFQWQSRQSSFPVLRALADARMAEQVIRDARQRMAEAGPDVPAAADPGLSVALPAAVRLEERERALWVGRPERVPWWFGLQDAWLSLFGLVWLAGACMIGVLAASTGGAWILVVLIPLAAVGGLYPAAGRLIHRRLRVLGSTYVLTDQRLIATWQLPAGEPVVTQSALGQLLPPELRGGSIFTSLARPLIIARGSALKTLAWPASTLGPPSLVGVGDPQAVRNVIAQAQLSAFSRSPAGPENAVGRG